MTSTKSKNRKQSTSKISNKKTKLEMKIPDAWINELETLEVNDMTWNCIVVLFVEQCSNGTIYTDIFNEAATNGNRLSVKVISRQVVISTVIKNVVENSSKYAMSPMELLCSEIYKAVGPDFKKNIAAELLAPLIKYILLDYKEWHKRVKEGIDRIEKGLDDCQQNMLNLSKAKTPIRKKSKYKENSMEFHKSEESKRIKTFTKLRRRGEEWKDIKWIDDSPSGSPELYILISTFYDVNLILELLKLGMPLRAVVKMEIPKNKSVCLNKRPTSFLSTKVNNEQHVKNIDKNISDFWEKLDYLSTTLPSALLYEDIMVLTFVPQHINLHIKDCQVDIYKELSDVLYKVFEITELHKDYLREMKIINVADSNVCVLSEMSVYNSILDNIPHEVLTIPLIIDALLTQVCSFDNTPNIENKNEESKTGSENIINETLIRHIDKLNFKYDLFHNESANNESRSPSETLHKIVLQYSDDIKLKTVHLEKEIADSLVLRSNYILKTAWKSMLGMKCVSHKVNNQLQKLCNEIIRIHQETNHGSLFYYVYLIIINNVLDSLLLLNDAREPCKEITNGQYNFSDEEYVQDLYWDVRRQFSNSYLPNHPTSSNEILKDIIGSNTFYIEHMCTDVLLQNIQSTHLDYNRLEKRICQFTDQVMLIYHNIPHYFEETWVGKLTTQVPLRDFVEYVLEEENIWFSEKHDELLTELSSLYSSLQQENEHKVLDFSNIDVQFISNRCIKYKTMIEKQKHKSKSGKSSLKDSSTLYVEKTKSTSTKNMVNDGPKRTEIGSRKKIIPEAIYFEKVEKRDFKFLGYDQGRAMRFQLNGCKKSKILDRNCKVVLEKVKKVYGTEYILLNIRICDCNLFYSHSPESKLPTPFHVVLSSGTVIYFGLVSTTKRSEKTSFHLPQSNEFNQMPEESKPDDDQFSEQGLSEDHTFPFSMSSNTSYFPYNIKENKYYNIPFLYTLKMSTPSGLHVELEEGNDLMYVRQTQLSTRLECSNHGREKSRCYLSSGFIVKFFDSGKIVALGASGEIYTIYHKSTYFETSHDKIPKHLFSEAIGKELFLDTKSNILTKSQTLKEGAKCQKTPSELQEESNDLHNYNTPKHSKEHTQSLFSTNSSMYSYYYNFISSDGKQYEVNGTNLKQLDELLMTSYVDITNNCITSERSDGTITNHLGDGTLIVTFPDGSRVTSVPVQSEDVFCEWSTQELRRWFDTSIHSISKINILDTKDREILICNNKERNYSAISSLKIDDSQINNNLKEKDIDSLPFYKSRSNQSTHNKLHYSKDGFVVYNISYRFEHANYCSIFYDANKHQIDFELPQSTKLTLQNDGVYKALFDNVSLVVDDNNIYFNKHNESGDIERTNVINKSTYSKNDNIIHQGPQKSHPDSTESVSFKSLLGKNNEFEQIKSKNRVCSIFNSTDCFGNEMYIDHELKFHDLSKNTALNKITEDDFACFIVDRDLRGFRVVSSNEADKYFRCVAEKGGLVRISGDTSTLTSIGIGRNEMEKWLMLHDKERAPNNLEVTTTTYGSQESWLHPFREKVEPDTREFKVPIVTAVRVLQKIPTENVLSYLQRAFEVIKVKEKSTELLRMPYTMPKGYLNITDIVQNPDILEKIYEEENIKKVNEEHRKHIKQIIVRTMVRQACIKSSNLRMMMKNKQMKTALQTKAIPPYYLSCFGSVNNILDEVFNRICVCQNQSFTDNTYSRINILIDSILNFSTKYKTEVKPGEANNDTTISTKESTRSSYLIKENMQNFSKLTKDKNQENINMVLEKPLSLVTLDEVNLLCQTFEFQSKKCPLFINEEFTLQDILEAGQQLTHYFYNLRNILECYRCSKKNW